MAGETHEEAYVPTEQLERLAAFEPAPYPVVSLYLNTQPGQHGRDQHQAFIRKEFKARSRTYPTNRPSVRASTATSRGSRGISKPSSSRRRTASRSSPVRRESCSKRSRSAAPIEQHWLHIGDQPHLYPLARLESQYPRYAAVLDRHQHGPHHGVRPATGDRTRSRNVKTREHVAGRMVAGAIPAAHRNFHLQHAKEVIDTLDRVVRDEGIAQIVLSCDEVIAAAAP